jgi:glutathione S-transferase
MAATRTDVITLHGFGPCLGTPDSSPFVIKVMLLLKFAGLPFRTVQGNPLTAPHRLLPTIEDDGVSVADSSLIRRHIENKYHLDFDKALNSEQIAIGWAVGRMCEDHLYFTMLDLRWIDNAKFNAGLGAHMFGAVPAPSRPLVKTLLRRMNAKRLHRHGIGRHARAQIADFAIRDVGALAATLGDKPYLNGDKPCGADAFAFGIITAILTPPLDSPIRTAMHQHANLVAYRDRITRQYFSGQSASICSPVEPAVARHVG